MSLALQGRRLWVTRPQAQADPLCDLLQQAGATPVRVPLLHILPPKDPQALHAALARLGDYAVAIAISPSALDSVFAQLGEQAWPTDVPLAVVGPGSARRARELGLRDEQIICPATQFDSEGLLAEAAFAPDVIQGQRVLILRGNGGRELLAQTLIARGAQVDIVSAYRRLPPQLDAATLARLLDAGCDGIIVSSSEAAAYLFTQSGAALVQRLQSMQYFTPHPRIAAVLAHHGASRHVLTEAGDQGIVNTLCRHFNRTP